MQQQPIRRDIVLAKTKIVRAKKTPAKRKQTTAKPSQSSSPAKKQHSSLSKLLTPKNIQESLKSVSNLRSVVKNWLQYLNQADQVLDTIFVTSSSLKESGVLDKVIKQRGKNLSSEDFTNVLIAFMNSPIGSQFLKGLTKGSAGETQTTSEPQQEQT